MTVERYSLEWYQQRRENKSRWYHDRKNDKAWMEKRAKKAKDYRSAVKGKQKFVDSYKSIRHALEKARVHLAKCRIANRKTYMLEVTQPVDDVVRPPEHHYRKPLQAFYGPAHFKRVVWSLNPGIVVIPPRAIAAWWIVDPACEVYYIRNRHPQVKLDSWHRTHSIVVGLAMVVTEGEPRVVPLRMYRYWGASARPRVWNPRKLKRNVADEVVPTGVRGNTRPAGDSRFTNPVVYGEPRVWLPNVDERDRRSS